MVSAYRRGWGPAIITCVLLVCGTQVWSQQPRTPAVMPLQRSAPAKVAPRLPVNAMAEAAQLVGMRRCLPAIKRLSSMSLQGSLSHDVVLDWDRQQPDTSAFFGLMGVVQAQTGVHATALTAVPDSNGDCTVLAERMAWAPKPCHSLAREELPGYAVASLVPDMVVLTHPLDSGSTISLLEAGPGCMVLRRFVQYRWRDAGVVPPDSLPRPFP